jgi:hypothetical protein
VSRVGSGGLIGSDAGGSVAPMMRARFLVRSLLLGLVAAAGLGACTKPGGRPPVDSPVYAFQPADPDEFADPDAEDDDDGDATEDSD